MKVPSCPLALRCGTEYIEVAMFFAPAAYLFFWFGCLFFFIFLFISNSCCFLYGNTYPHFFNLIFLLSVEFAEEFVAIIEFRGC